MHVDCKLWLSESNILTIWKLVFSFLEYYLNGKSQVFQNNSGQINSKINVNLV